MKDNFSENASAYSKYRPDYPEELINDIVRLAEIRDNAWDCGTGNGQAAAALSNYFQKIYASDISKNQIENAEIKNNIEYSIQPAENTNYPDNFFNLIISAQAAHWFNLNLFYNEVKRTAKPDAIIAIIGYGLITTNDSTSEVIRDFYERITGPYWDPERKYLDDEYRTIPFPFEEIILPSYRIRRKMTYDDLVNYFGTWSAVHHYRKKNNSDPLTQIETSLKNSWGNSSVKDFYFPVFTRIGRIRKTG